jgi:hypothetical protein
MFGMIHPSTCEPLTTMERSRVIYARDHGMRGVVTLDGATALFFFASYDEARKAAAASKQWSWTPIENFFKERPVIFTEPPSEAALHAIRKIELGCFSKAFEYDPAIHAERTRHIHGY